MKSAITVTALRIPETDPCRKASTRIQEHYKDRKSRRESGNCGGIGEKLKRTGRRGQPGIQHISPESHKSHRKIDQVHGHKQQKGNSEITGGHGAGSGIEIKIPSYIDGDGAADHRCKQDGAEIEDRQLPEDNAGDFPPAQPDLVQHLVAEPVSGGVGELLDGEHRQCHADKYQPDVDQGENDGGQQEFYLRNQIVPDYIFHHIYYDLIRTAGHKLVLLMSQEILAVVRRRGESVQLPEQIFRRFFCQVGGKEPVIGGHAGGHGVGDYNDIVGAVVPVLGQRLGINAGGLQERGGIARRNRGQRCSGAGSQDL